MPRGVTLDFQLRPVAAPAAALPFEAERLVIAGWAGRDETAVRRHIEELAELGVPPPSRTPLFYSTPRPPVC